MKQNRFFSPLLIALGAVLIIIEGLNIVGGGMPQTSPGIVGVLSYIGFFLPMVVGVMSLVLGIRLRKSTHGRLTRIILTAALSFSYIAFYFLFGGLGIPYGASICMMLFPALAAYNVGWVSCVVVALAYPYTQLHNFPIYLQSEAMMRCLPVQMISGFLAALLFVLALRIIADSRWSRRIIALLCGWVSFSVVTLAGKIATLCIIEGDASALSVDASLILIAVAFIASCVTQVCIGVKRWKASPEE